eukprot:TRINITY_DN21550_c0_g1_i1.p1 TRINITY_DN21550_c0_g1~~TRINITY_DN21550_c0_g1_i1.p1  ORF type:complete len:4167 (+),score=1617.38 TRINITY_DN21550_c0_g1_i1:129-12503(+)
MPTSPSHQAEIKVTDGANEFLFQVPSGLRLAAQDSAQRFGDSGSEDKSETPADLAGRMLRFLLLGERDEDLRVAVHVLSALSAAHLKGNDVHCLTDLSAGAHRSLIRTLYDAQEALDRADSAPAARPQLVPREADATLKVFALFGGQGTGYMRELVDLHQTYAPLLKGFLGRLCAALSREAASLEAQKMKYLLHGLDPFGWITGSAALPPDAYLTSAPVSLPMVGLTQLCQYVVSCKVIGATPGEMRERLAGATGHSQGGVAAVAVASASTWEELADLAERAVRLLFWLGLRAQEVHPLATLDPRVIADSKENNEGAPQPMMAIMSLPRAQVVKAIDGANQFLEKDRQVVLSLVNGPAQVVVSGPRESVHGLNVTLRNLKGAASVDQSRVPFSKRKVAFHTQYLPSSVPFHSPYLAGAVPLVKGDIARLGLEFDQKAMAIPVLSTDTGRDLREVEGSLAGDLVEQICTAQVHWPEVCKRMRATHMVDFGPGGVSGLGNLTHRNVEGSGVCVIVASAVGPSAKLRSRALLDGRTLYDRVQPPPRGVDWGAQFAPRLVRCSASGKVHIDTRFSRLIGRPPLMVAGMTPWTMPAQLNAAVINAGYHIEVSGGGHFTREMMTEKIHQIQDMVQPGQHVSVNMLYLNAFLWNQQYPLLVELRSKGVPVEGCTVAAGVPTPDKAKEIVSSCRGAGMKHISFKPGSEDAIRQVCDIAAGNPDMGIVLQWTGGRGGGHHSFEDQHDPILRTYALMRRVPNLALVVGSGFGDAAGSYPWMTGEWSERFGRPRMPFDGVLLATRVGAAKEAATSPGCKELLVAATGIPESEQHLWEKSYSEPVGGICTVTSELGEPIHKIANRGIMLWKELDDTIFSLPREKQAAVIRQKREYIIQRLNADFQKPYFGARLSGDPCEVGDMTYEEVTLRLVALLYVPAKDSPPGAAPSRWVDPSMRAMTVKWMRRVEERFCGVSSPSLLPSDSIIESPQPFVDAFLGHYPQSKEQVLCSEDVHYFMSLCAYPLQKPVPFVPALDERFVSWFKKDSLWQSEDVDAVPGRDPQKVAILAGPVAVHYIRKADEPVKDILDGIYTGWIDSLQAAGAPVAEVAWFGGGQERSVQRPPEVVVEELGGGATAFSVAREDRLPSAAAWLDCISGERLCWLKALLCSPDICTGAGRRSRLVPNRLRAVLQPRAGQRAVLTVGGDGIPVGLRLQDAAVMRSEHPAVEIARGSGAGSVSVTLYDPGLQGRPVPLELRFRFDPELCPACPIHEDLEGRTDSAKRFYAALWMGEMAEECLSDGRVPWQMTGLSGGSFTVTAETITNFCRIVGNDHVEYIGQSAGGKMKAPMDVAIVAGWRATVRALFPRSVDGDLLSLVHLENGFRMLAPGAMLDEGDTVDSRGEVTAVTNDSGGNKVVEVRAVLSRSGTDLCEIRSRFLYRGASGDWAHTFRKSQGKPAVVRLPDPKSVAVVKSKDWIKWTEPDYVLEGTDLTFHTETFQRFKQGGGFAELTVSGTVTVELSTREVVTIGRIDFRGTDCAGDPVAVYLTDSGKAIDELRLFEHGGAELDLADLPDAAIQAPQANHEYSSVSGDCNPIHTNPFVAALAGLPGPIVHGMWTSAAVRNLVETFAADNKPQHVVAYSCEFLGMVMPGDRLTTTLVHAGMTEGRRLITLACANQHGQTVLKGTAEVEEPPTAFVFTGQGSQAKGMGMDLYKSSAVARGVWHQAEEHLKRAYGFSILQIVRENPKELTVYFGGKHGAQIRENYRALVYQVQDAEGKMQTLQLFPSVKSDSVSYTFRQPDGLLNATQFTQPALTLMQVAAFRDMESRGLVQRGTLFAGHSLGEYSALAALVEVLPVESLVDVVFYRGMTMQVAVPRDQRGRSDFGMAAVSPARVGDGFDEPALRFVVQAIARDSGELLEIVNFNVYRQQYVCSGHLLALDVLGQLLNFIRLEKIRVADLLQQLGEDKVKEQLAAIIAQVLQKCRERAAANGGRPVVERGIATIPLPGIDVPFHSSYLLGGVSPFREVLRSKIRLESIDVNALRGRYIPNLVAKPFDISRDYVELVRRTSQSPVLGKVLDSWKEQRNAAEVQLLGYQILVELLAYQFASPVRWIETQQELFGVHGVQRLVEIGPEPTLTTMAERTLKAVFEKHDQAASIKRRLLHAVRNHADLYYEVEAAPVEQPQAAPASAPLVVVPDAVPATVPQPAAAPAAPAAAAAPVADAPPSTSEKLRAICALKFRRPVGQIAMTASVKQMAAGKSTLQNEILGDLNTEFPGFGGDKVEDEPLTALAKQIKDSPGLGKVTSAAVNKLVSSKMPGGFGMSQLKGYLGEAYGLGAGRTAGVLLHGCTMEPPSRLGGEPQAKAWVDSVVSAYADLNGVPLAKGAPAAPPAAAAPVAAAAAAAAPASVPDAPVTPLETIRVLVASKLKRPAAGLDGKSIKELVGGKSTMQNEILGDLGTEFGDAVASVDSVAEIPLGEVAKKIPRYAGLGRWAQKATQRLVSAAMPGSFGLSAVRDYLAGCGLGPGRTDGVLLHAVAMQPPQRLGSDAAAQSYWESVVSAYAALNGVAVGGGKAAGAPAAAGAAVTVSSAELRQLRLMQQMLAREQMNVLAGYLQEDLRAGWHVAETAQGRCDALLAENDAIRAELGDAFLKGITPQFSAKKVRSYGSFWNWVRVDIVLFFHNMLAGKIRPSGLTVEQRRQVHHVMNRANRAFFDFIGYYTKIALAKGGQYFDRSREAGYTLARDVPAFAPVWMLDKHGSETILSQAPAFVPVGVPTAPKTEVSATGEISYAEVPRLGVTNYTDYAKEIAGGIDLAKILRTSKMRRGLSKLQRLTAKSRVAQREVSDILDEIGLAGALMLSDDSEADPDAALLPKKEKKCAASSPALPLLYLSLKNNDNGWEYSRELSHTYIQALNTVVTRGVTFSGKVALVNGANRGSICSEIVKGLLSGGAQVVVLHRTPDTRVYSNDTRFYREMYEEWGAKGSKLWVLPFNGGSAQDCQSCVDYVYDELRLDVDFILPFAAMPQMGIEAVNIGEESELALRIMLTNINRLLGAVARRKERIEQTSRPAMCVLPLSPNHGTFGGDGFYAEAKIGLEPLFNKWHSEHWGRYLSIIGASMGWVRGTGLMSGNNMVAEGMEKMGVRTFSQLEMAINIIALMHPQIVKIAEREPFRADFCGGLQLLPNVSALAGNLRSTIREVSDVRRAVTAARRQELAVLGREDAELPAKLRMVEPRANNRFEFPALPKYADLAKEKSYLKGMVDLEQIVVCTGYGEVGPWGNARTRWEMEADGVFSLEGCLEMAWIMGLIRYERSREYTGWVTKSGERLKDIQVKQVLEKDILAHSGIRFVEPDLFGGYDPRKKSFLHQVQINHDMAPVECGEEEARAFKAQHGDSVDIWEKGDGVWAAKLRRGASIYVPKALSFSRLVAGQIPTGWDAARYGVPKDICEQVDPVTLFNLVSTVEALVTSGITDPYEFYKYVHISEVGNTSGGGVGGLKANEKIFRKRFLDSAVQNDILQEMFINTMPAWVNMLLLSSSGPIKTPVGACATAAESVEVGVETILSGKAKVVICGGYDDFGEDASYEFANMKATSDAVEELAAGREPKEMSRPATTSRAGFMESQGAGNQVLMSAAVAIEMGVPIYGIVALTNTATDRQGRSVPAPGQGILTTAREVHGGLPPRELNLHWRREELLAERRSIAQWVERQHAQLERELEQLKDRQGGEAEAYAAARLEEVQAGAKRRERAALDTLGQGFYKNNPRIAPIRGALAVWGLDVDDIAVASFHGTSTQANDRNESDVLNTQMTHLGRSKGNPLPCVLQKWLTGHPKGAAAAWMFNGCLQMMNTGVIPGNRNADDIDEQFQAFQHLIYPSRTVRDCEIKACLLKSFGFGQAGGEILLLHPDFVLATLDEQQYARYSALRARRQVQTYRHYHDALSGGKLAQIKDDAPYTREQMKAVFLDPTARASWDAAKGTYTFHRLGRGEKQRPAPAQGLLLTGTEGGKQRGIGCDVELLSAIPMQNSTFIDRNYTEAELEQCQKLGDLRAALAARWAAKEAVIKAVSNFQPPSADPVWQGAGAPVKEIEVLSAPGGGLAVKFSGAASDAVAKAGVSSVQVNVALSGAYAIAVAKAS